MYSICFKSMDTYNYFVSGFVKEVGAKVLVTYVYLLWGPVIPKSWVKRLQLHGL